VSNTDTSDPDLLDGGQLLSQVSRHVYLVALNIGWAKLSYKIADAVVEVGSGDSKQQIAKKFRNDPQWALLPDETRLKFVNLEGKARKALNQPAIGFATKGMAMLPITKAPDVFQQLRDYRSQLFQMRDSFCSGYDGLLERLREELGAKLYDRAAKKLPKSAQLREMFKMVWAIIPLGGGEGSVHITLPAAENALQTFRVLKDIADRVGNGMPADDLFETLEAAEQLDPILSTESTLRDLVQQIRNPMSRIDDTTASELVQEARDQMNQFTVQMVEDMAREPREEIRKACENMLTSIRQGRRVKQGTIEQCRRAFELMNGFSFLADAELINRMRTCDDELRAITPTDVNQNAEVGARLANVLARVVDQASSAPAVAAATRQFRAVRLRPRNGNPEREAVPA